MELLDIFVLFIITTFIMLYVKEDFKNGDVEYVEANDGRRYLVKIGNNNIEIANKLAVLNDKFQKLIVILKKDYANDPRTNFLIRNYNPDKISESTKDGNYTSFSLNKEEMIFCLRARNEDGTIISDNTMAYVGFHELAHLATDEIGHTDTFWKNFKWMLNIAKENGLYMYVDYSRNPEPYCGIMITSNILDS